MKNKRALVLIDGSNFYFKLKELKLSHLLDFDFSGFAKLICGKDKVVCCIYYIGAVRTDGSLHTQKLFSAQRKLLANLKKHHFDYSLGYLLKINDRFHEKGVDVNIAVDILICAYEKLADRIILVSSDTDLLPAIRKACEKGIAVEHVGFSHQPSLAMIANCSESRLLKRDDLLPFIKGSK